jgi:hypothetical protein
MKSRRRIAFPKAGTTPIRTRLQQGFAMDEMGSNDQFALQKYRDAHVCIGSEADIAGDSFIKIVLRIIPLCGDFIAQDWQN